MKIYFSRVIILQRKAISIFCLFATEISKSSYVVYVSGIQCSFTQLFFSPSTVLLKLVKFTLLWCRIHTLAIHSPLNDGTISIKHQI